MKEQSVRSDFILKVEQTIDLGQKIKYIKKQVYGDW
jgi:hypothetical protein